MISELKISISTSILSMFYTPFECCFVWPIIINVFKPGPAFPHGFPNFHLWWYSAHISLYGNSGYGCHSGPISLASFPAFIWHHFYGYVFIGTFLDTLELNLTRLAEELIFAHLSGEDFFVLAEDKLD